jgi:hypothetical protein
VRELGVAVVQASEAEFPHPSPLPRGEGIYWFFLKKNLKRKKGTFEREISSICGASS